MSEETKQEAKNYSDHDLLITVSAKVENLEEGISRIEKGQDNHLEHHKQHDRTMLFVTLGSVFTAIIAILSTIFASLIALKG